MDHFDKFWFVNDWQIPRSGQEYITESKVSIDCTKIRCLLITSTGNNPSGWRKLDTVNFLDGSKVFEIYANN